MIRKANSISKLWKLALASAMFLSVSALQQGPASAAGPCARFPQVCHYTYDPVENCCNADPKFDCFDVCF